MAKFKLLGITGAMLQSFLDKMINEDKTTTGEANKLLKLSDLANTVKHIFKIRKTTTDALDVSNDTGTSFLNVNTEKEEVSVGSTTSAFGGGHIISRPKVEISTTPTATGTSVRRNAVFVVSGVNQAGDTINFVDLISSIGFSSVSVISSQNRNSPAARTYTMSGNDLFLAMASGTYDIRIVKLGY